jgi:hypothetical protein
VLLRRAVPERVLRRVTTDPGRSEDTSIRRTTSVEQWCAVVGDVEDLFDTIDTSHDPFEIKQLGYDNGRQLFAQLSAGLPHLDAAIHEAVQADIEVGNSIAIAFVDATDPAAAAAALAQIDQDPLVVDGVEAVSETCDVDLEG